MLLFRRDLPLRRDCLLLLLFWLHLRRMGAAVRDIMPQRRSQLLAVVGAGVLEFPFQSIVVVCPLCGEQRRYLPSGVVLETPHHLVAK